MTRTLQISAGLLRPIGDVLRSGVRSSWLVLLYLIIPLVFLENATTIHSNLGKLFMNTVDPEYFYLYNGMQMSRGKLSVQYTAHPGTPLQAVVAVACAMVGVFQSDNVLKDMVNDPEKYIHAANHLMVLLIAVALFFLGWHVRRISGSWFAGVLLQLTVPGSASLLCLTGRVNAEAMLVLPVLLLCSAVFHHIYADRDAEEASGKTIALFGVILGFGGAVKVSFFPLIVVPWVLLGGPLRQKAKLLGYTLLSFAVFAYPVVLNNGKFWSWLAGVLSHTGKYGTGPRGFIDLAAVPARMSTLYHDDTLFFPIAGVSLLAGTWLTIRDRKAAGDPAARRIARALLAVPLAIAICMVLVLKHFELYYFVPFFAFKLVMIALFFLLILNHGQSGWSPTLRAAAAVLLAFSVAAITFDQVRKVRAYNQHHVERKAMQQQEYTEVMAQFEPGSPLILSGAYYGTPFVEFAHYDGYKMAGKNKGAYTPYLRERFPVSYQYVDWSDKFYFWDSFADFNEILARTSSSFYIFLGQGKEGDLAVIEQRLYRVIDPASVNKENVYHNDTNGDRLIRMTPTRTH